MKFVRLLAGVGALTVVAACGSSGSTGGTPGAGGSSAPTGKIALLLPETKTARYEASDRPDITARLRALGYDTSQLIYSNANQDAATQQNQADAAITNGAKVLILDPVDSKAAGAIATKAQAAGVPVIAYDRLIKGSAGVTAYVSFDNVKVGELQAQSLMSALTAAGKTSPHIVMINGSPTDANAASFKKGAHNVFDPLVASGKLTIDKEYDTPDWSPDQAQNEMQQALTALAGKVDGVYCANDGTAGGAIAALKAANVSPLPPVTGQDAEVAGVQRVLAGEQYMTIYKAVRPEAELAAQAALDLLGGRTLSGFDSKTNNDSIDVPSHLLNPVAVTKSNVKDTIIADQFHSVAEICTAQYAAACKAAGIQ
ncbi:MAG TPA: sugar ABC transporter substrate-binding protein [Candidatus Dormibacteraeota bacterium]|jgi:D-xylose transport system substrate-binding protein